MPTNPGTADKLPAVGEAPNEVEEGNSEDDFYINVM